MVATSNSMKAKRRPTPLYQRLEEVWKRSEGDDERELDFMSLSLRSR
jgi:hypothetical protein